MERASEQEKNQKKNEIKRESIYCSLFVYTPKRVRKIVNNNRRRKKKCLNNNNGSDMVGNESPCIESIHT